MIIGIGTDLVKISRIEAIFAEYSNRFVQRILRPDEQPVDFQTWEIQRQVRHLAKRYAAKEAAAKALGTGIAEGVTFHDFAVGKLPSGQPVLSFYGKAEEKLLQLPEYSGRHKLHLSLTDDGEYAGAYVVIDCW